MFHFHVFGYTYANYGVLEVAFSFSFLKVVPAPTLWSASLSVLIDHPLVGFAFGKKKRHLSVKYQILLLVPESLKVAELFLEFSFLIRLQKQMWKIKSAVTRQRTLIMIILVLQPVIETKYLNLY